MGIAAPSLNHSPQTRGIGATGCSSAG